MYIHEPREGVGKEYRQSTRVEVFMDYVCPFCFLVENAIEELKRDRDVKVRIRPFELRPDPVPTLRPEDEYLPRVWKASAYPMAERLGFDIRLPSVSPQPRTEKAFLVLQLAEEQSKAEEYSEAMFKAFSKTIATSAPKTSSSKWRPRWAWTGLRSRKPCPARSDVPGIGPTSTMRWARSGSTWSRGSSSRASWYAASPAPLV